MRETIHDPLTGLRERVTFFSDVEELRRSETPAHIVLIQTPFLLQVNHKFGIKVCDQMLKDISAFLDSIDPEYTGYRIANSRFMLIGSPRDREHALGVIDRIRKYFEGNIELKRNGETYVIPSAAYIVHHILEKEDVGQTLLDKLNFAYFDLQDREKEGVAFFDDEIRARWVRHEYVADEVRYAIEHKTFRVYYQPIFQLKEGRFASAEALVRLFPRNPFQKMIGPGEFIELAEKNGTIEKIDWIVIEKVCAYLAENPELPLKTISVNVTGDEISDPDFCSRLEELLDSHGVDGSRLRIEITERTVTGDMELVKRVMERLGTRGIRFYLDDFGTGYSNLSAMISLPFEVIKFDKSLVDAMGANEKGERTVDLLAQIMHTHEYEIVAEGIEDETQVEKAKALSLDRIQGYYYSRPLPGDELPGKLQM